jgi:hypothetical protein
MSALERQLQASVAYNERKKVNASLAVVPSAPIEQGAIEQVLAYGDLTKLTSTQRTAYYSRVCESLGLNPLTRPFEFINLSGKLVFYARRDCADQLRNIHHVTVAITSRERVDDVYVVTARATLPNGRSDESTGAVTVGNLKGDALANALMKAETKAKRRVTLSICGLSVLDESELETVISTTPQLPRITAHQDDPGFVHVETGAFEELSAKLATLENDLGGCITLELAQSLRGAVGSPNKQSPVLKQMQRAGEANELDAEQRKALSKCWGRISRRLARLEDAATTDDERSTWLKKWAEDDRKERELLATPVVSSFIDEDPENFDRSL